MKKIQDLLPGLGLVSCLWLYLHRWTGHGIPASIRAIECTRTDVTQADLGSSMPTSGGLYWWTHFFSSPATRNPLSFLVGYSNTLGLVGGLCSIDCRLNLRVVRLLGTYLMMLSFRWFLAHVPLRHCHCSRW